MTGWQYVSLGELVTVKHGFAFKGAYFEGEGDQLVLTPGNFSIGGGLQLRDGKERFYSRTYPKEYRLSPGDLLVAMTDLTQDSPILGSPIIIPQDGVFLHNQRLGKVEITDENLLDKIFLYYLFVSDVVRSQLRGSATGSTVRHTAPGRIFSAKFRLPPLDVQKKVASILAAYDDLIENNNRRMKLLEEMAQRIYREWFIDFRYPGHEGVPLVDSQLGSIPVGWAIGLLKDLADVNASTIRGRDTDEPIDYIDISSVERGTVKAPKRMMLSAAPGRARRRVSDGDILWSTVRPNLRAYALVLAPKGNCVASTGFAVLSPRRASFAYVYALSTTDDFVEYLNGRATGSAYPAVTSSVFENASVLLPPGGILQAFAENVEPLLRLTSLLATKSEILSSARDLLLPRLISGDVDVTDLDISVAEPAV